MLNEVKKILSNPIVKTGLRVVAPELVIGVDLALSVADGLFKSKPSTETLVSVVDKRLAEMLSEIATTESKHYRRECEIRAHELLFILNEWGNR
jgi:hypothetical protein